MQTLQIVVSWIMAHQVLMAALAVAVLDFLFAIVPSLQSNGVLHAIYLFATKEKTPKV